MAYLMLKLFQLLILVQALRKGNGNTIKNLCDCRNGIMTCNKTVPFEIPMGISTVFVKDWQCTLPEFVFEGSGWQYVTYLDISTSSVDVLDVNVKNGTFANLRNLKHLGLHFDCFFAYDEKTSKTGFYGLDNLKVLDLSNNPRFDFNVLNSLFMDNKNFPHIDTLKLNRFSTVGYTPLSISKTFQDSLAVRSVKHLEACENYIYEINAKPESKICSSLVSVKVRDSTVRKYVFNKTSLQPCLSWKLLDISGLKTIPGNKIHEKNLTLTSTFKTLSNVFKSNQWNMNSLSGCELNITIRDNLWVAMNQLKGIRTFLLDRVNTNNFVLPPCILNIKTPAPLDLSWSYISIQQNNAKHLDFRLNIDVRSNISTVRASFNNIEYLGCRVFIAFPTIRNLNLSNNNLFKMATNAKHEFTQIFIHLNILTTLDLSSNQLTYVPSSMFSSNVFLTFLYLNNNKLTEFYQESSMDNIEYIDLSDNAITHLNKRSMDWLENTNSRRKTFGNFTLNLDGNRFICNCDSLTFIRWFLYSEYISKTDGKNKCHWKGKYFEIDSKTYAEVEKDCTWAQRTKQTVIVCTASVVAFIAVTAAAYVSSKHLHKRITRRRKIKSVLKELQEDEFEFHFLAFILQSEDDFQKDKTLLFQFKQNLEDSFGLHRKLICTTEPVLSVGRSLLGEAFQHITNSAVVLAAVTEQFCQCEICHQIMEVAFHEAKPVVLVFFQTVSEDQLSSPIRELAKRAFKVNITDLDGSINVSPPIQRVNEMILESAYKSKPG